MPQPHQLYAECELTQATECAICWSMSRGYFLRFGTDYYDRDDIASLSEWERPRELSTFSADDLAGAQAVLEQRYPDSAPLFVYLADNEWGNETMRTIAAEAFAQDAALQFVEVHEHAGWYLGFRRNLSIYCTANDMARLEQRYPQPGNNGTRGSIRRETNPLVRR